MMSISQIDMVEVLVGPHDGHQSLQVCGNLEQGGGAAAPPSKPHSFLVVVRQGGSVAALQGGAEAFTPETGRWEFTGTPEPGGHFENNRPAVASAVVVLECEPAGLETLSWVQPVEIVLGAEGQGAKRTQVVAFDPKLLAQPPARPLEIGHSVSSSLAITQSDGADGPTFKSLQRFDELKPGITHPAS
jgi:hypothetical protein